MTSIRKIEAKTSIRQDEANRLNSCGSADGPTIPGGRRISCEQFGTR
jgi:hypothetical protein